MCGEPLGPEWIASATALVGAPPGHETPPGRGAPPGHKAAHSGTTRTNEERASMSFHTSSAGQIPGLEEVTFQLLLGSGDSACWGMSANSDVLGSVIA